MKDVYTVFEQAYANREHLWEKLRADWCKPVNKGREFQTSPRFAWAIANKKTSSNSFVK